MSLSKRAQLVLMGLAAAGLSVSFAVSNLFWGVLRDRWFILVIAGFSLSLVGALQSKRPVMFVLPFTGVLIGGVAYAAAFVRSNDLGLFLFLVLWGPSLLATPWFVAQLEALWRSARGTPPRASA